jgi:hypothetical protein
MYAYLSTYVLSENISRGKFRIVDELDPNGAVSKKTEVLRRVSKHVDKERGREDF